MRARVLTLCAVLLLVSCVGTPEEQDFARRFESVTEGESEVHVLELLGSPDERDQTFQLSQREGFESIYEGAARSGSTYWLRWRRSIDLTYTVGFDTNQKVRFKAVGGT